MPQQLPPRDGLLLRRSDANRDQRSVGRRTRGTAGRPSFAEELRLISGRAAIGRHQDFVVLALHRATRHAIRFDHPDAWAGRTRLSLRSGRTGRSGWACRTSRAGIALRTLRPRGARVALRAFAAASQ